MHVETYSNDFSSSVQVNFNFELSWKKNWFPCCGTREDLSVDVSITYVGLILTKPGRFFSQRTKTRGTDKIQFRQFRTFLKKNKILRFLCCSTCEDLSIDASITNVGLILKNLRWFQLFGTSQNSISNFFEKNQIFRFPCCSTREDLSIDVSFTNVGLILTKPGWFLFSGYGQTDRPTDTVLESSYGIMSTDKKFQLKAQN